jgi:hypothetical protein
MQNPARKPPSSVPSAEDLRAELARRRLPAYVVGARARIHPTRLGRLLRERITLTPELAARIWRAIHEEAASR